MPWISRGSTKASRIYIGTTPVTHVYRGSTLIWKLGYGSTYVEPPPSTTAGWDFTSGTMTSDATLTRSGTAWKWNASKVLVSSSANAARIDYDPETGSILGLLVEPAATNLLLWGRRLAQGISGGAWVPTNVSAADNVVGRDGVAAKGTTLTSTAAMSKLLSPKTAAAASYTFSAWVKRKTGYGPIDVTIDGGATWSEVTAHVLGGQWVRVGSDLLNVGHVVTNPSCGFRFHEAGDQIEVDLCQLETSPSATSEIPTEGSTVTRNAESLRCINITGAGTNRGYDFAWPAAAEIRNARWIKSLTFSNVVADTSADITVTYITGEPGKPTYVQTIEAGALTL